MSNTQLGERQEREQAEAIAAALGITADELEGLDWTIDDHASGMPD